MTREVLFTRQQPGPQRLLAPGRSLLPARLGAGGRIVFEGGAVGGGDGTLGRQRACRRTAGDAFGADERVYCRAVIVVIHNAKSSSASTPERSGGVVSEVIV